MEWAAVLQEKICRGTAPSVRFQGEEREQSIRISWRRNLRRRREVPCFHHLTGADIGMAEGTLGQGMEKGRGAKAEGTAVVAEHSGRGKPNKTTLHCAGRICPAGRKSRKILWARLDPDACERFRWHAVG